MIYIIHMKMRDKLLKIIKILKENQNVSDEEFLYLLTTEDEEVRQHLFETQM